MHTGGERCAAARGEEGARGGGGAPVGRSRHVAPRARGGVGEREWGGGMSEYPGDRAWRHEHGMRCTGVGAQLGDEATGWAVALGGFRSVSAHSHGPGPFRRMQRPLPERCRVLWTDTHTSSFATLYTAYEICHV